MITHKEDMYDGVLTNNNFMINTFVHCWNYTSVYQELKIRNDAENKCTHCFYTKWINYYLPNMRLKLLPSNVTMYSLE